MRSQPGLKAYGGQAVGGVASMAGNAFAIAEYNDGKGAADIMLMVTPTQKFGPPPPQPTVPSTLPAGARREIR